MGNYGHGDNAAREKFPRAVQRQFRETLPFLVSLLCYTQARGDARSASHRALYSEPLLILSQKKATCHFLPQKKCLNKKRLPGRPLRPRPSLSQHQPLITVIVSARMSETAPILDTADLQPWMDNVILTLVTTGYAYPRVYSINTSESQPQGRSAIKGSAWPIL